MLSVENLLEFTRCLSKEQVSSTSSLSLPVEEDSLVNFNFLLLMDFVLDLSILVGLHIIGDSNCSDGVLESLFGVILESDDIFVRFLKGDGDTVA